MAVCIFGSNIDGQTWTSYQTIYGDEDSALVARGHFNSVPGSVKNYVELLGDMAGFYGTLIVQVNETMRLGCSRFPGTVRIDTQYSALETMATDDATIEVGTLKTLASCSVAVAATNRLLFSNVDVSGTLDKAGAGTFGFKSATFNAGAALRISAGGLKPLAPDSRDGVPLTIAERVFAINDE